MDRIGTAIILGCIVLLGVALLVAALNRPGRRRLPRHGTGAAATRAGPGRTPPPGSAPPGIGPGQPPMLRPGHVAVGLESAHRRAERPEPEHARAAPAAHLRLRHAR